MTSPATALITSRSATFPTLLERYLSAARKISRLAMGTPGRSPGGDTITLPPDLTQEDHFDELPLGTRGGTTVRYTFRWMRSMSSRSASSATVMSMSRACAESTKSN